MEETSPNIYSLSRKVHFLIYIFKAPYFSLRHPRIYKMLKRFPFFIRQEDNIMSHFAE